MTRLPGDPLLRVEGLRTYFSTDGGVLRAVDGVSLALDRGERRGLVGESGAGKTVTALSLMRLIDPPGECVAGRVLLEGVDLLGLDERAMARIRGGRMALISQNPGGALNPVRTVGAQLVETIRHHRPVSRPEAHTLAAGSLADVGLPPGDGLGRYPHQLSGGMRQRVMVALALSCDPDLVIADEPTSALDATTQAQVLDLLVGLTEERGTALLLITHDLGVVAGVCDRVDVMYAGAIVERGTAEEVYHDPQHPYTRGLLGAVIRPGDAGRRRLRVIPGDPPSRIDPPAGCPFRPRCRWATGVCAADPELRPHGGPRHLAACHHAGEPEPGTGSR